MPSITLNDVKEGITSLLFPRLCEGCRKPLFGGERVLCISCCEQIPETNYHHIPGNETAISFSGRIPFVHATSYAYFTHGGLLQHLVHALKYKHKKEVGHFLGQRFGRQLQQAGWHPPIDVIIPVPLFAAKKAARGYNQSMLIAQAMAGVLGTIASDDILVRTRDTASQTRKTREQRVQNMSAAFVLKDPAAIAGRHVLLCDDVLTTGATLEACAHALMTAGNVKISLATIGIAVS